MSEIQSCFKRVEKKYMLTREQYKAMLLGMAFRMVPDEHPRYTIGNVYYDTADYDLIRASLEKPVYKEKLRVRSYGVPGDDGLAFVEIKIPGAAPLWLAHLLSENHIVSTSFSKYGAYYKQAVLTPYTYIESSKEARSIA